jgi:membrane-associated protease RseP (regulator of RpoE activity)
MRAQIILTVIAIIIFSGCASSEKKAQTKEIYERPWIGGSFERVSTPAAVRTNAQQKFAGHGMLVTRLREETPLAKAGVAEGDLLLAVNGKNVRFQKHLDKAIDNSGADPIALTIFRAGEIAEKSIIPGVEQYQKIHHIIFAIGLSTRFDFDIFPNPNFSLVALGYETKDNRLDIHDAVSKYRIAQGEDYRDDKDGWKGLSSEEGWKAWLGPFAYSENKLVISQEPAP